MEAFQRETQSLEANYRTSIFVRHIRHRQRRNLYSRRRLVGELSLESYLSYVCTNVREIGNRRVPLNNGDTIERRYYLPLVTIYGQSRREFKRRRIDLVVRSIVTRSTIARESIIVNKAC